MKNYGFGFAVVALLSAQNIYAGGYDPSAFGSDYTRMSKAAEINLSYLERQCRRGKDPLFFRRSVPEAYGFALRDQLGVRHQKLIPIGNRLMATSPGGQTRRLTFLNLESGIPRLVTKTIFVNERWKHENVVEVKWLDGIDDSQGSVVVKISAVSNRFRVHPVAFAKPDDLCSQITGFALAQRLNGPLNAVTIAQQPSGSSIKIEITR